MSRQAGARHWFGSGSFAVQRGAASNLETIRNSHLPHSARPALSAKAEHRRTSPGDPAQYKRSPLEQERKNSRVRATFASEHRGGDGARS